MGVTGMNWNVVLPDDTTAHPVCKQPQKMCNTGVAGQNSFIAMNEFIVKPIDPCL